MRVIGLTTGITHATLLHLSFKATILRKILLSDLAIQ
jgi:hypothetical protein